MVADIGRWGKTQATHQSGTKITYNISLQVGKNHHIKQIGAANQFHTEIIYDHIIGFQFGVFFGNFIKHLKKQPIGQFHDIGLMTAGDPSGTFFLGHFESIFDHLHTTRTGNKPAA